MALVMWPNLLRRLASYCTILFWLGYLSHYGVQCVDEHEDNLLCRYCGRHVASSESLVNIPSEFALYQRNDTVVGIPQVLIQLLENPDGNRFEVINARYADVQALGPVSIKDTWFPGFLWKVAFCESCGQHLGWIFCLSDEYFSGNDVSAKNNFVALILENLVEEQIADTLLHMPKFYKT